MERVNKYEMIGTEIPELLNRKYKKYFIPKNDDHDNDDDDSNLASDQKHDSRYLYFEEVHKELVLELDPHSTFDSLDIDNGDIIIFQ